jgi:hypothetical protein
LELVNALKFSGSSVLAMEDVKSYIGRLEKALEQFFDSFPQAKNNFVCETQELDERQSSLPLHSPKFILIAETCFAQ